MKNIKAILILLTAGITLYSCRHGSVIIETNGDDYTRINYEGDIKFSDDEKSIASITPEGYLKYNHNDKQLVAESNYHGQIHYTLTEGSRPLNPNDPDGKRFMADAIRQMIRLGFDAKDRLERIYKKGGNAAVLNEVDDLQSDFLKNMYLGFLLKSDSISKDDVRTILKKVVSGIGGDFDKQNLLKQVPDEYLQDSLISHDWFVAVNSLGGDFNKSDLLRYSMHQPLTLAQTRQVLSVESSFGSDFEKSNVLKTLIAKKIDMDTARLLEAVNGLGSDFEKAGILRELIESGKPSGQYYCRLLDVTAGVGSDYEKANLLKELMGAGIPRDACFDELLSMINHIGGDFDKSSLLKFLVSRDIATEEQWIAIVNSTGAINSDFEKGNLLVAIAASGMPRSEPLKTAFAKAARTINSETDYGRVMKAVD